MARPANNEHLPFAVGFKNPGVACFSNALLQGLITSKHLTEAVDNLCAISRDEIKFELSRTPNLLRDENDRYKHLATLYCEITKVASRIPSEEERKKYSDKYNPILVQLNELTTKFYNSINSIFFNGRVNQQDSQEVLTRLMDGVFPSLLSDEITKNLYRISRDEMQTCWSCGSNTNIKNTNDTYITYNFTTQASAYGTNNLSFDLLIQTESNLLHDGKENTEFEQIRKCKSKCQNAYNKDQTIRQIFIIKKLPKLLFIHVPRYISHNVRNTNKILSPPNQLTLNTYNPTAANPITGTFRYNLIALICHVGEVTSGHYYCIAKRYPNDWYELNDTRTTKLNQIPDETWSRVALILYEQI